MPDPSTNKTIQIQRAARAGGYAVVGSCCYNVEGIVATVRAAEAQRAPCMILLFPWALTHAGSALVAAASSAAAHASVPVSVHLDHAQSEELVRRAADMGGFDSIMCDMSHHERDENLALTRDLATYCHARGVAVEAEPGRIDGGEDGVADVAAAELEAVLTTPDEARDFVATGIDMLAPAFGNVHGAYGPRGVVLDYDRLAAVEAAVGDTVTLVLHGTNSFTADHFRRCVAHGITRVNVNRAVNAIWTDTLARLSDSHSLTEVLEKCAAAMQRRLEQYMVDTGSSGKA